MFHQTIVDSLDNVRLWRSSPMLMAMLRLALFKLDLVATDNDSWVELHGEILGLLSSGDRRAAAKLMEKHLKGTEKELSA